MFEKEVLGLQLLQNAIEINVSEVLLVGEAGEDAFLLLPFISSSGMSRDFWEIFGKRMAALHSHKSDQFGLDHNNYMGSLPQSNHFHKNWEDFFNHERL